MQRCFKLYDVRSQSQYSVNQRREEMMNEGLANDESHMDSETFADDMPQTQVPETQESEEVYRVNISDQTRPSSEFSREPIRQGSPPELSFQNNASRGQQQGRTRRESGATRVGGSSRAPARTSSRGIRKKQYFQTTLTDTMDGFREFQRQSLQQLRPDFFDQDNYDECERAIKIFESMEVPKNTEFYWACIQAFKDDRFWRKYFIDRADNSIEDKL